MFSLQQALDHPWMKLLHPERPPDYIPQRAAIFEPFDEMIIGQLKAMGFGKNYQEIQRRLGAVVNSPEYKTAVDICNRDQHRIAATNKPFGLRKSIMLAVSERRRVEHTLQRNYKPQGGFYEVLARHKPSPLLAMYYLIQERREWEGLPVKKRVHTSTSTQSLDLSKRLDYRYG
jgi:hypothetical protein